jgi:hypothetical protein
VKRATFGLLLIVLGLTNPNILPPHNDGLAHGPPGYIPALTANHDDLSGTRIGEAAMPGPTLRHVKNKNDHANRCRS